MPSRPTTPLRKPSTSTDSNALQPGFTELSDGIGDLEINLQHMDMVNTSLCNFNESFAALLYGLQMNAWCVEFDQAPVKESFTRSRR